jgi:hypothetical protein
VTDAEIYDGQLAALYRWCVYIHRRPDGSPFYVGKGTRRRAIDFSPSRRTVWHRNVVAKHGRENIRVQVIPCVCEAEAFALERVHIAIARADGSTLANLTDGGEGASGHVATASQLAALAKGRVKGKRGVPGPRPWLEEWKRSPAGQEHLRRLGELGAARLHRERTLACCECGTEFVTKSAQAKCCSRKCEQRYRRAGKNK